MWVTMGLESLWHRTTSSVLSDVLSPIDFERFRTSVKFSKGIGISVSVLLASKSVAMPFLTHSYGGCQVI